MRGKKGVEVVVSIPLGITNLCMYGMYSSVSYLVLLSWI